MKAYAVVPGDRSALGFVGIGRRIGEWRSVLAHAAGGFAATAIAPRCRRILARVARVGDVPIGRRRVVRRQAENRREGHMAVEAAVVAEDELVEVGVEVLAAKAVICPEAPAL